MAWTYNITRQYQTKQRKNGFNQQIETTTNSINKSNKYQNTKIVSRRDTIFCKTYTQPFRENRQYETTTQKRNKMGLNDGQKYRLQQNKTRTDKTTLPSTLQRQQR